MIKDGMGHYIEYDVYDPTVITAEGDILNGKWEGEVKGFLPREGLKYAEVYKNGVLVSGLSADSLGNEYKYSENKTGPIFKDGMEAFYKYVLRNLRYPASAQEKRIGGKAFIKFQVDTDGNASNFINTNYVNAVLAQEAIRVIKAAGTWMPGRVKGKPVNMFLNIPFNFAVN
ncbi:energy transducer TonB [Pedobacter steynii]